MAAQPIPKAPARARLPGPPGRQLPPTARGAGRPPAREGDGLGSGRRGDSLSEGDSRSARGPAGEGGGAGTRPKIEVGLGSRWARETEKGARAHPVGAGRSWELGEPEKVSPSWRLTVSPNGLGMEPAAPVLGKTPDSWTSVPGRGFLEPGWEDSW